MKMRNKAVLAAFLFATAFGAATAQACPFAEHGEKRACSEHREHTKSESCANKRASKDIQKGDRWEAISEEDRETARVRMNAVREYMSTLSPEERAEFKEYLSKSRAKRGELSFDRHHEHKMEKDRYCDLERKHAEKHRGDDD